MSHQTSSKDPTSDDPDVDYLRSIERLAHEVVEQASREGSLTWTPGEDADKPPLQRSINALARTLRMAHFEGDGCIDHR